MPRAVAIFYAAVGTGHRAAADALAEWCAREYPDARILCRDLLDYVPQWIRWSVTNSYLTMARRFPWFWGRLYLDTDTTSPKHPISAFWRDVHKSLSRTYLKNLLTELDTFDPDAVLVTHFFGMPALLDIWAHRTPIYFVGTDFASHSLQRDPRFDGWFVGSEESARQHRADNVPTPDVTVVDAGIPISAKYATPPGREEARERLGIEGDRVTVAIVGGGTGADALGEIADSMLDFTEWRVEVVCGDNKRMYEQLRDKYYPFKHISVHESVENIALYYAAADVAALKPGGLSLAEAAAVGAAILLIDPLPGLERHNADYVLERGAARRIYENRKAGEQIAELMATPDELARMRERARAMSRPCAARDILAFVMEKLDGADDAAAQAAAETKKDEATP